MAAQSPSALSVDEQLAQEWAFSNALDEHGSGADATADPEPPPGHFLDRYGASQSCRVPLAARRGAAGSSAATGAQATRPLRSRLGARRRL